jgi:hypothetical protein
MNSYLFFYLFYNIHNGRFLDRLKYKWITQKYTFSSNAYFENDIRNIYNPQSILEFAENTEYFIEGSGFYKELNLFETQYFHYLGESLYSLELDFICMAYGKKKMSEIFTVDESYEKLFALVASEYAEHTEKSKIELMERHLRMKEAGIKSKSNFGHTNNSLGFFSKTILNNIQDRFNFKAYFFTDHNEMYKYFLNRWENNSTIKQELLIAKKIVDEHLNLSTNFLEIIKNGFELNREISLLIKKLEKNEK